MPAHVLPVFCRQIESILMVKFGVITFGYGASSSQNQKFKDKGLISINLGDYMQTLAVREAYRALGITDSDTIDIDRDNLPTYDGPLVKLVMNGCFYDWCFPLAKSVIPIFIGFQAKQEVIDNHIDEIRPYQPIGCRDEATAAELTRHGVQAYVSGCLTLTFPLRAKAPAKGKTFIVYGDGAGALPTEILRHIPSDRLATAELVHQRKIVHELPLSKLGRQHAEDHARRLLEDYSARANLVITPLHHAAAPCAAMGIPVVICRRAYSSRFSTLRHLLPFYEPKDTNIIDWDRAPVDLSAHRQTALNQLAKALAV
jgi:hypothetical protein